MTEAIDTLIIFGCGGHCRSVTDVLLSNNPGTRALIVDTNAREEEKINGFPVVQDYPLGDESFFLAIGNNLLRKQKLESIAGHNLISIISNQAHKSIFSNIATGCFVGNFCHVGAETRIGKNTILNTASVIEHEIVVGDHCHIGPSATILGRCNIGDLVFVGAGATVKENVNICSEVTIGAGATVVKSIEEPGVYVGCPAKKVK